MDKLNIIQDTREQKGLFITASHITFEEYKQKYSGNHEEWLKHINKLVRNKDCEWGSLKTGDYSLKGYEDLIVVERKGPMDAFSTLGRSTNHARFNKEWERAKHVPYFAVIIELGVGAMYNKEFPGSYNTKLRGPQILQTWVTHSVKRGYHLFFVNSPAEAKILVRALFKSFVANYDVEAKRFKP